MQQLLLFGAPQALNSSVGADGGMSTSSNGALNNAILSDSAGFAEAMRSVLLAQSGSKPPAHGEGAAADVSFSTELLDLPLSASTWQQSAASFNVEGQPLPLSPMVSQPGQAADLTEVSSALQVLLNSEGLTADTSNVADVGNVSPIALQGALDTEENAVSALDFGGNVSDDVQSTIPVEPKMAPQLLGAKQPNSAIEIGQALDSASVTGQEQIQPSVLANSQPTPAEASVAGSSYVQSNAMEPSTNRTGSSAAGATAVNASALSGGSASLGAGNERAAKTAASVGAGPEPAVKAAASVGAGLEHAAKTAASAGTGTAPAVNAAASSGAAIEHSANAAASLGAGTEQAVKAAASLAAGVQKPGKAGVIETVVQVGQSPTAEASTSESQRQLASQWNNYLQGGVSSQPSAQSDVNFKLSMEKALSGVDAEPGGDVPDELLAKLSEPAAPKVQVLSQRATATADKPYSSSVNVPVGDPEWGAKMNEKVVWLSGRGIQSAQIHLNPVELGPVDVKVSVQNDQTVITFNVQNAGVKELLDSNVQRLREMIDQNGNAEIEVNVEDRSSSREGLAQHQQNSQQDGRGAQGSLEQTDGIEDAASVSGVSNIENVSLVDYYA